MSIAETVRAAGSKVRKAMQPPPPSAADLATRIRKATDAQATAREKHAQAAIELSGLSTLTPEGQVAKERADTALARVTSIGVEIQHLEAAWNDAVHREAEQSHSDWQKARATELNLFGQRRAALLKTASEFTQAMTAANDIWVSMVKETEAIMVAFPQADVFEFNTRTVAQAALQEVARVGAKPVDWNLSNGEIGFPGSDSYRDFVTQDAPERIAPLAETLAAMLEQIRDRIRASANDRTLIRPTDADAPAPVPAPKRWPARSPSRAEIYDAPPQPSAEQRTDIGVDGRPVTRLSPEAAAAERDALLVGMARDPAALAVLRGETIDFGRVVPVDRSGVDSRPPPLHQTIGENGEWLDRDGNAMPPPIARDAANPHGLPPEGKEPAWNQGILTPETL